MAFLKKLNGKKNEDKKPQVEIRQLPAALKAKIEEHKKEFNRQVETLQAQYQQIINLRVDTWLTTETLPEGAQVNFNYDTCELEITAADEKAA